MHIGILYLIIFNKDNVQGEKCNMKINSIKKMIAFVCAVSVAFFGGGNVSTSSFAASKFVYLSKTSVTLKVGKTYNLTVKKAKKVGKATITVDDKKLKSLLTKSVLLGV